MTDDDIFKGLGQGRLLWLVHQCLVAYEGNVDRAISDCENYTGTSEALLVMLRLIKQRNKSGQFLPRKAQRHGST